MVSASSDKVVSSSAPRHSAGGATYAEVAREKRGDPDKAWVHRQDFTKRIDDWRARVAAQQADAGSKSMPFASGLTPSWTHKALLAPMPTYGGLRQFRNELTDSNSTRRGSSPHSYERASGLASPDRILASLAPSPWPEERELTKRVFGASNTVSDDRRS